MKTGNRQRGSVMVLTALMAPLLIAFGGLAIDGGEIAAQSRWSQNAADAAALGAAYDLTQTAGFTTANADALGRQLAVENNIPSGDLTLTYLDSSGNPTATPANVAFVQADITHTFGTLFLPIIKIDSATTTTRARATVSHGGGCGLCVLDGSASRALQVTGGAQVNLNAPVWVNSNAADAIYESGSARLTTTTGPISVVGTTSVPGSATVSPAATTGAAVQPDPLLSVPTPDLTALCGSPAVAVPYASATWGTHTVTPGCYSSFTGSGGVTLNLASGIYVISGLMTLNVTAITGNNVFLYFACGGAAPAACPTAGQAGGRLDVNGNTPLILTSPASGIYQGLTIMYDRNNTSPMVFAGSGRIQTTGTVYAARSLFNLSGGSTSSSYNSRFVVGTFENLSGPTLNINYTSTQNYITPGTLKLVI